MTSVLATPPPSDPRDARVLIIGTGICGLRTAKTLLDDGFKHVHLVSESLSAGGIWALDDAGTNYPGLITNSGFGDFEFSTAPMPEDPEFLKKNENRISGATVGRYLEDFFENYIRERAASIRFGHRVLLMDRVPGSSVGWKVQTQDIKTGETSEEFWDKVVLSIGWSATPKLPTCFTDPSTVESFEGILTHSSKISTKLHDRILALPPSETKMVVVGAGKSAIDLAQLYAGLGRDVTIVFRKAKVYAPGDAKADAVVQTRIGSTLSTPQHPRTRLERFLHTTRLGGWIVKRLIGNVIDDWCTTLKIAADSPLAFLGSKNMLYFGPSSLGGRAMSSSGSFHSLINDGKIKAIRGVAPVGVSSDGKAMLLSDGQTLKADVVICATGFGHPLTFMPHETQTQLGLALEAPRSLTNRYEGLAQFPVLQPVPAPPRSDSANHVYRGIVPAGALESRDLAVCGGAFAIKVPFISEISSHWISSFFLASSHLTLPSSISEAFEQTEDHAEWIRARYPLTPFPWGRTTIGPFLNTDQYVDDLLGDMGVETERREMGRFGLGYYTNNLTPSAIKDLGEERRALRVAAGEE